MASKKTPETSSAWVRRNEKRMAAELEEHEEDPEWEEKVSTFTRFDAQWMLAHGIGESSSSSTLRAATFKPSRRSIMVSGRPVQEPIVLLMFFSICGDPPKRPV